MAWPGGLASLGAHCSKDGESICKNASRCTVASRVDPASPGELGKRSSSLPVGPPPKPWLPVFYLRHLVTNLGLRDSMGQAAVSHYLLVPFQQPVVTAKHGHTTPNREHRHCEKGISFPHFRADWFCVVS